MLKKIFNHKFQTITSAAIVLGAAALASRLLGVLRDAILTNSFPTKELDIYYAAFRVPDLVYYLGVLGAVSAGLIPVFVDYLKKDKIKAWYMINSLVNVMFAILVVLCFVLIITAPWLMKLIVPGFDAERLSAAVALTRIMFLSPLFLGLSAIFGGVLQSFRRFFVYAIAPIIYNIGIIFGAVVLAEHFGMGLMGLAYGVVIGAFLHMVVQLSSARACGFKWQPIFDYNFSGVRRVLKVMPPRTMGLALNQLNVVLMTVIASTLSIGSIAFYNLAYNIWSVPLGVFGISFVTASFPKLSEQAQKKAVGEFLKTFIATARQILFLTVPSAVIFIVLRAQIVRVIYGHGKFVWTDTVPTFETLGYFCLGLFAEALVWLFLRGFFAWEDAKTPFLLGLLSTAIRMGAAWFFASYWHMGVKGLALGFSAGSFIYLVFLFMALSSKLRKQAKADIAVINKTENDFFAVGIKMILAAFLAGLAAYSTLYVVEPYLMTNVTVGLLLQGLIAGSVGMTVYFLFSWFFKIEELSLFYHSIRRRWPWKKIPQEISEINGK